VSPLERARHDEAQRGLDVGVPHSRVLDGEQHRRDVISLEHRVGSARMLELGSPS